jgi:hypothetical protein
MEMSPHYRDRGGRKHVSGKARDYAGAQNYESDNRRGAATDNRCYRRKTDGGNKYYDDERGHGISSKKYRGSTPQNIYEKNRGDNKNYKDERYETESLSSEWSHNSDNIKKQKA